jgi:tetratricopeptide (TPR) repeat protein
MGMLGWMISEAAVRAGQLEEAQRLAMEAKTFFQRLDMPYEIAISHFALGLTNAVQEKWDEALTGFEQALNIYRTLNHPWDIAVTLYEMGMAHTKRKDEGDQEKAQQEFEEAFRIFTELKAQPSMDKVNAALDRLK